MGTSDKSELGANPGRDAKICIGVKEYEDLRKAITDVLNHLKASRTIPNKGPGEWHYRPLPEIDRLEQAELATVKSAVTVQSFQ